MPEREEAQERAQAGTGEDPHVSIDLHKLYAFEPSDLVLDIASSHYSNLAYVQVTHRDVYIDFLEMPGTKRDGKMAVKGVRVYMSPLAAKRLAEVLGGYWSRNGSQISGSNQGHLNHEAGSKDNLCVYSQARPTGLGHAWHDRKNVAAW